MIFICDVDSVPTTFVLLLNANILATTPQVAICSQSSGWKNESSEIFQKNSLFLHSLTLPGGAFHSRCCLHSNCSNFGTNNDVACSLDLRARFGLYILSNCLMYVGDSSCRAF